MDAIAGSEVLRTREQFDRMMKRINTAIPGKIISFDASTQTCSVLPAVQIRTFIEGSSSNRDLPQVHNVPLVFPFSCAAGLALTFPVLPGDPCLLVFSQRCIDEWHALGGVQTAEPGTIGARHHDINDGFAILCAPPLTQVLGAWCQDGIELRNRARDVRVTIKTDGVTVEGPTQFLSPVTFEAPVTFNDTFTDSNGVEHTAHKHVQVKAGTDVSGVPTK